MKKFILSLIFFHIAFGCVIIASHVVVVFTNESRIISEYSFSSDQDVLFLGSSQIGCSILERPEFHNKVIWTSSKPIQSTLVRLLELERRGLLAHVKTCFIRLNGITIEQQDSLTLAAAWYNEFPVSWRYSQYYDCSSFELLSWLISHLRFPFLVGLNERPPKGRLAIVEHDDAWRKNFYSIIDVEAAASSSTELRFNWSSQVDSTLLQIKGICARHQIRLYALDIPFLPHYQERINPERKAKVAQWKQHIRELGIEFVDIEEKFGDDCYFDEVHMVERGAEKYTRALYRKLELPLLSQTK